MTSGHRHTYVSFLLSKKGTYKRYRKCVCNTVNNFQIQFDLEYEGHRFVSHTCTRLLSVTLVKTKQTNKNKTKSIYCHDGTSFLSVVGKPNCYLFQYYSCKSLYGNKEEIHCLLIYCNTVLVTSFTSGISISGSITEAFRRAIKDIHVDIFTFKTQNGIRRFSSGSIHKRTHFHEAKEIGDQCLLCVSK